jgi:hypothetical protein
MQDRRSVARFPPSADLLVAPMLAATAAEQLRSGGCPVTATSFQLRVTVNVMALDVADGYREG